MMTNLDPASELFLSNIDRIHDRLAEANRQVSSGRKVVEPSDAPDQVDAILQLRADRERNAQIRTNLGLALTGVQGADGALTAAIRLMDRARVLATQACSTLLDANNRQSLAGEVQSLIEQMVSYSQTAVQGRFLFSGDRDDAPAYELDSTSPTGVARLLTDPATRRIESPAAGSFAASKTAQEIFDNRNSGDIPAADNVFAALSGLRAALLTNSPAGAQASVTAINAASVRLNSMQSFYGGVQSRINDAISFAERYDSELRTQLSQKEDADVAAAALEVTQGTTQLQAAFQMRALLPRQSLFDFLG